MMSEVLEHEAKIFFLLKLSITSWAWAASFVPFVAL